MSDSEPQLTLPGARPRSPYVSAGLLVTPLALLLLCTVYGVTEVHSSTDTYIGLAGGRAILESTDGFPVKDTYSYTFQGEHWINQNWLTHAWQYWLYRDFGPDAVIWGTWAMSTCIFLFSAAAVWFRTRSMLAALVAASVVAFGCRDFISARPATTGFFAISAMWMLVCALEGTAGSRRRVWPLVGMFVLLVLWGCAHGSFIFGYVIFGMFAMYWVVVYLWRRMVDRGLSVPLTGVVGLVTVAGCLFAASKAVNQNYFRYFPDTRTQVYATVILGGLLLAAGLLYQFIIDRRREPSVAPWQLIGIGIALVAAFVVTLVVGPFGFENFTHAREVRDSEVWRSVSEWHPPYFPGRTTFPPFDRIWYIFSALLTGALGVAAIRVYTFFGGVGHQASGDDDDPRDPRLTAFDVLVIGIALIMTFFARRFAPIFLIFAAPAFATWFILVVRQVPPVSRVMPYVVSAACGVLCIPAGWLASAAVDQIHRHYPTDAEVGLLEKVTRFDATPSGLLDYLAKNEIEANVMAEWTQSGMLMFFVPTAKVYMDGRAQQVYDVEHYKRYQALMHPNANPQAIRRELDRTNTDMVMLRMNRSLQQLHTALSSDLTWLPLISGPRGVIMIRRESPLLQELRERADRGEEWRPNTPAAQMGRGFLYRFSNPPDRETSLKEWVAAVQRDQELGRVLYRYIVGDLVALGALQEAAAFIKQEQARLAQASYSPQTQQILTQQLRLCQQLLVQARDRIRQRGQEGSE